MASTLQTNHKTTTLFHFVRPRLNNLFTEAVRYPLVVVCAGAGYGKTSAIYDFVEDYQATTAWIHLSERDNVVSRFWEKITHNWLQYDPQLAGEMIKLGFPDTKEKLNRYLAMVRERVEIKSRIVVFDDVHCIEEPQVIHFLEEAAFFLIPPGTSMFILSRTPPRRINIANLTSRDQLFNVSESDLRFTENELAQFFRQLEISVHADSLREIMQDTEGWAFAINLIARSYQRAPGYGGYVRNAMKTNIFRLMETEIWAGISGNLQNLLVRLSLIDHLSVDLITLLAGKEKGLIAELEKQNAYMRLDSYINAYLVHPLFLEFLSTKQDSLSEEQKRETYTIAGNWCAQNGFKIDAVSYYEKTGDYQSILSILAGLTTQIPQDIVKYAAAILDRAPAEAFDKVAFLADMHLRTYISQGFLQKSLELVKYYEEKFLKLPDDDSIKKRTLTRLYICWTYIRCLMSVTDDIFDYDIYIEKACKCVHEADSGKLDIYYPGAWLNYAGSSRKGGPEEFIAAITRNQEHISQSYLKGFMAGELELVRGELEFYRGNASSALPHIVLAVKQARTDKQFGLMHRALLYALRIAVSLGNFVQAEQVIKETKDQIDEVEYVNRFLDYDVSLSWYYCFLGLPEKTVDWLKEDFSPYSHPAFIDNFWNQIKARYCYATRNFSPLLSYIGEMKMRESFLYGRLEMLAIEACVHYKLKNKEKAFASLEEAYKTASPNGLLMPFIELGKDMRTLTGSALQERSLTVPKIWLEDINRKSASYAKHRAHVIVEYKKAYGLKDGIILSPREAEILADLSHGLSRVEIASSRNLSVNTVKMVINTLFKKVNSENVADLIRLAVELKLI